MIQRECDHRAAATKSLAASPGIKGGEGHDTRLTSAPIPARNNIKHANKSHAQQKTTTPRNGTSDDMTGSLAFATTRGGFARAVVFSRHESTLSPSRTHAFKERKNERLP
jgi:hypothetical protein